jgi:hypothetical protein
VLKGVDGIVFVADSQIPLLDANLESFDNLRKHLLDQNMDLNAIPLVFQYNKRDLESLVPVETFNSLLNPHGLPYVESCAIKGIGVFETLKQITKQAIPRVKEQITAKESRFLRRGRMKVKGKEEVRGPEVKEEIAFAAKEESAPIRMTKVKFKSQEDIEKELENLAKEFTGQEKK